MCIDILTSFISYHSLQFACTQISQSTHANYNTFWYSSVSLWFPSTNMRYCMSYCELIQTSFEDVAWYRQENKLNILTDFPLLKHNIFVIKRLKQYFGIKVPKIRMYCPAFGSILPLCLPDNTDTSTKGHVNLMGCTCHSIRCNVIWCNLRIWDSWWGRHVSALDAESRGICL